MSDYYEYDNGVVHDWIGEARAAKRVMHSPGVYEIILYELTDIHFHGGHNQIDKADDVCRMWVYEAVVGHMMPVPPPELRTVQP